MLRLKGGDETALEMLCEQNQALMHDIAKKAAFSHNCYILSNRGLPTPYTLEVLSDLESVGMTAFIECVRGGGHEPNRGKLTTYVYPFVEGAMRRYLESSMGTLAIDRDSMTLVRKVQEMYHAQQKSAKEIASELDIPMWLAAKHIGCATHFFSVYDCVKHSDDEDDSYDNDIYDHLAGQTIFEQPSTALRKKRKSEYLHTLFLMLSKREQDILGKCYGVFGHEKQPLTEIGMYHFMKVDAVKKARVSALGHLRGLMREHPNLYALAETATRSASREYSTDAEHSTQQSAWYEEEWALKKRFSELIRVLISVFTILREALEADSTAQPIVEEEPTGLPRRPDTELRQSRI